MSRKHLRKPLLPSGHIYSRLFSALQETTLCQTASVTWTLWPVCWSSTSGALSLLSSLTTATLSSWSVSVRPPPPYPASVSVYTDAARTVVSNVCSVDARWWTPLCCAASHSLVCSVVISLLLSPCYFFRRFLPKQKLWVTLCTANHGCEPAFRLFSPHKYFPGPSEAWKKNPPSHLTSAV